MLATFKRGPRLGFKSLVFLAQTLNELMHGHNRVNTVDIGTAKGKTLLKATTHGIEKNAGNTVGRFFLIAGLHAVENAFEGFG